LDPAWSDLEPGLLLLIKVSIIGGGIGGIVAAIALRANKIDAEVYEQAAEWAPLGAGILIPSNAMQVLTRLGLSDLLIQNSNRISRLEVRDSSDKRIRSMDLARFESRHYAPTVAIHRASLHKLLLSFLPRDSVHLDHRCESVDYEGRDLRVRFLNGNSIETDLLIGADGLRSVLRRYVAEHATERYSGQSSYRAVVEHTLKSSITDIALEFWGVRKRFGLTSLGNGRVYWYATFDAKAGKSDGPGETRMRLGELSESFPSPAAELIAKAREDDLVRTDIADLAAIRTWHKNRIVLIGDAAHASTPDLGQGGAQAIEDAFVLAWQLEKQQQIDVALDSFERIRRAKAIWVVRRSRALSRLAHLPNPFMRWLRDWILRSIPSRLVEKEIDALLMLNY
jgi:2-polyprenyl-6-methoxyphenol hydroxylase-like FAD-dependent oxidoreductase